jgi:hypothetical protein
VSGGSYDYLYSKLEAGEVDAFEQWASQLDEDLAETAEKLRAGAVEVYVPNRQPYPSPAVAALAVDEARKQCAAMSLEVAVLRAKFARLAGIARACEWSRSGDTGPDDVADACLALAGLARAKAV